MIRTKKAPLFQTGNYSGVQVGCQPANSASPIEAIVGTPIEEARVLKATRWGKVFTNIWQLPVSPSQVQYR
jgi:hypothetical protein